MNRTFATVALAAALVAPSALRADDTNCTSTITGTHDNVIVPSSATCIIKDAYLKGNVKVSRNAAVTLTGRTYVNGNVQSEDGGRFVRLVGPSVTVGGNVQIKKNYKASSLTSGSQVLGNLQYEENSGSLYVNEIFVRGDLQVFKNSGGIVLSRNTIRQNLQCKENYPAPEGGANRAGDKEDQCKDL